MKTILEAMKQNPKVWIMSTAAIGMSVLVAGCEFEADIASKNLSRAADNFEVVRRVVFYNGITDEYILVVEGRCSMGNQDDVGELTVTCKTGDSEYKKHFLGLSDNVTYFAEQLDSANVSGYHYRVEFRPQSVIPDVDFQGDTEELFQDRN